MNRSRKRVDDEEIKEAIKDAEYDSQSLYLAKQERIKKEINRLKRQFKDIPLDKKNLVMSTLKNVAFMTISMEDLEENIIRDGTTVTYKNGENQYGEKQSPDAQLYLQFSQKHTQAMRILLDCLPKTSNIKIENENSDKIMDVKSFALAKE